MQLAIKLHLIGITIPLSLDNDIYTAMNKLVAEYDVINLSQN